MMKNFAFPLLVFFYSLIGAACDCSTRSTVENAQRADFIAIVEIINMTEHPSNDQIHIPKYNLIELFKGEESAYLEEFTALNSSCSFFTPIGSRFLIFAFKNSDGVLRFGFCSGSFIVSKSKYLNKNEFKENSAGFKQYRKIELLRHLSNNNKLNHEFQNIIFKFSSTIYPLKIQKSEKVDYSIFEYSWEYFIEDGSLSQIKPFNNFRNNREIVLFLKNNINFEFFRQKKLQGGRFLFSLHYYPEINISPVPFIAIELSTL